MAAGKVEASVFARVLQDIEDRCLDCVRRVLQGEGWPARSWQQDGLGRRSSRQSNANTPSPPARARRGVVRGRVRSPGLVLFTNQRAFYSIKPQLD